MINDVGLTLDMLSSVVPSYLYLPTLCASAACKAACGVSAGSTKVCITNYFCLSNNVADVATKENTQETAVTLVGLVFGMLFSSVFGNNSTFAWLSFIVLTALHVYCNYRAVSCLKLNSINRSRCWFLTRQFLCSKNPDGYADMSLTTINALEGVVNSVRVVYNGPRLGIKLHDALESISSTATVTPEMRWNTLRHVFADDMYCILPMRGGAFAVPIRVGATKVCAFLLIQPIDFIFELVILQMDELKAFFHASMLQITSSSYVDTRMAPTVGKKFTDPFKTKAILHSVTHAMIIVFATEAEIKQSKEKLKKKWEEFVETLRLQVVLTIIYFQLGLC